MILFKVIDDLFVAIRYGSWGLGVLGIIASLILVIANLGLGIGSALLFVAALLVSIAITLLLAPSKLFASKITSKNKYIVSVICLVGALAIGGIVYFTNAGFPVVNLLLI